MAKNIAEVSLLDLIPPNLQADKTVRSAALSLDGELKSVTASVAECLHLPRLNELPEEVVDLLAWQWHVDFYEPGLSVVQKREMVRKSIAWHRRKGTPAVVQEVVSTVFADGVTREWFEYGGEPYRFRVETSGIVSDETAYARLYRLIDAVKNTRSWLESVRVNRTLSRQACFGIAMQAGKKMTLLPPTFKPQDVASELRIGVAVYRGGRITIGMEGQKYGI